MIVDTSALIAIALGEPETIRLLKRLHEAPTRRISIASVLEACLVLVGRLGEGGRSELEALLRQLDIDVVPVDLEQGRIAQEAAVRFGRGRHGAALNYGDCFSYALAVAEDDELLCVGDDFPKTDVRVAHIDG
jgi:ribonuclease VapC